MSRKVFMLIFSIILTHYVLSQNYGQTTNSQIGGNTASNPNYANTLTYTPPNTPATTPSTGNSNTSTSPSLNDYGQGGNNNPTLNNNNNNNNPSNLGNKCIESDSTSVCISKPTCCHVTNFYSGYTYSACIDVKNSKNFEKFCNNFFSLNSNEGFSSTECVCSGNTKYFPPK